jgi:UDP-glucose 4-epimerase
LKVLITGIAGLLGSNFAHWLKDKDVEIIGLDDFSGGYRENIPEGIKVIESKIEDAPPEIFEVDYVFHFAAYAAEGLSPFIRKYNYTNNLLATAHVVNECIKKKVKRLIFTSSMAVYGHGNGGRFDESFPRLPIDPYGIAKSACEQDIEVAELQHDLDYCIIRPHNVYGPRQNIWDKYRNVLGIWMYYRLNNKPMTIFGDGFQTRAFSYIDDIMEPLWNAAVSENASRQIINLGGIRPYTILEANDVLMEIIGGDRVFLEKRHEVHTAVPTFQKSIDILGYEDKTSLKEGLTKMWEWAKVQPNRERFVWPQYEVPDKIYSFWK